IVTMTVFGVLGYLMTKYGYPQAPLVLAFVLGPIMETALRQSLIMSRGDFLVFWKTPVSGVLMTVFAFIVCARLARWVAGLYRLRAAKAADQPSNKVPAIIDGLVLLALLLPSWGAQAQEYPTKSITIIAPYPPGGRTDLCGRTLAQFLKTELGQPVVVINKPPARGLPRPPA